MWMIISATKAFCAAAHSQVQYLDELLECDNTVFLMLLLYPAGMKCFEPLIATFVLKANLLHCLAVLQYQGGKLTRCQRLPNHEVIIKMISALALHEGQTWIVVLRWQLPLSVTRSCRQVTDLHWKLLKMDQYYLFFDPTKNCDERRGRDPRIISTDQ